MRMCNGQFEYSHVTSAVVAGLSEGSGVEKSIMAVDLMDDGEVQTRHLLGSAVYYREEELDLKDVTFGRLD